MGRIFTEARLSFGRGIKKVGDVRLERRGLLGVNFGGGKLERIVIKNLWKLVLLN